MKAQTAGGWRDFLPLSAVFAIGLILAISAFLAMHGYYQAQDRQRFGRDATYYSTRFKDDVARHVTSLAAIRAFVTASPSVTRWEFSTYAHQILPQDPGLRAVLWVPSVARENRKAYETGLQQDGLFGLRIRQLADGGQIIAAADRATYMPITYVEPFDGNDHLVGLDLSPIPRYSALFQEAERSGQVAASAPVTDTLVAGTHGPAVLLAFPLSRMPGREANDRAPLQGYSLGVLQFQAIITTAMGAAAPVEAAIAWQEKPQAAPRVLASAAALPLERWFGAARFHQSVPFDIAGRHFVLALRSTGRADPVTAWYVPAGASLLILALTALLAQNMATTILRKRIVERAVVARTAQLRAANESLRSEIEQRRRAEAELRTARDRAESASRAKSAFMATMSHELRTPLNAIIGFSSLLAQRGGETDYAQEILDSGKKLLCLINDILDLTLMDSGSADAADLFYPGECIAALVAEARPGAMAAGVTLKASVPDHLPALHGDGKRIGKAMAHLIANAVKFTPPGGAAVAGARVADGALILEVMDTGAGMPPEARQRLREAFSQGDGKLGRKYEGVGMGLTYAGKVAERHEATIDIVSEPGKGTRICLVFPRRRIARRLEVA